MRESAHAAYILAPKYTDRGIPPNGGIYPYWSGSFIPAG